MQQSLTRPDISPEHDPREVRRNFTLFTMDSGFYTFAMSFLDPSTVLPAFLAALTPNTLVIGAIAAIRPTFLFIPQLWSAHYLRNRVRHKRYLVKGASISRSAAIIFAIAMLAAGPSSKTMMLWAFVATYSAFWFSEGIVHVAWTDLVAKCIPERLRGRLFGTIQSASGILAAIAGALVFSVLSSRGPGFPRNYAILAALAAVFYSASLASLSCVREPDGKPEEFDGGFGEYMRRMASMLRGHAQFTRVLVVQLLMGVFSMSSTFYMVFAQRIAHIDKGTIGLMLLAQVIGNIVVSALVGYLSDRRGPRAAIILSAAAGIAAPALSLVAGESVWMHGLIFLALGGVTGSWWIGIYNFVLELAQPEDRKAYIGVMNTSNAPTLVYPLIGGAIVAYASFQAMFVITALASAAAVVLALGLDQRPSAARA